ncbi:hypothetical protein [Empedobacter falsenii]|uniref:hypothetical protein n=1 Tax=Empedobacter falsenii TaxID=343874 RepID=UPI001C589A09|nr:hypothetical protein [Empedobacter falsenii]MBW1619821.1 hypothetical protein [Empedobacter falsenii]
MNYYFFIQIFYSFLIPNSGYDNNYIGLPTSTNEKDYKIIFGNLIQSDMGGKFTPINDAFKGFDFDPELNIKGKTIKFNLPSDQFKIDSIRIEK